jgi:PAS domain S-box-containing protein
LASGEVTFWENTANPILDASGKIVACLEVGRDITERKQAEVVLKDSEERYRELANSITDVFFAMDEHLKYTYWNKASETLTGIRADDALGKSLMEVFPESTGLRKAEKAYHEVLRKKQPQTFVNDFDINGRHYIFEISAYPSQDGVSVFARDITAHKQSEEALQESEEKYRALFDNTAIGTIVIDAETMKVMMANRAAAEMFGLSSVEEAIGANPLDFAPPEEKESLRKIIGNELFERDLRQTHELRLMTKDGREIWVGATAAKIMHEGKAAGLVSLAETTERKKAEEALNLQKAYFQQLFDTSPDAIIMMDTNDRAIQANKGFEKLFGYSNEEAKGRSIIELIVPEEDAQEASKALHKILTGEVVRKERVRRRKDGSLVDVSVLAYPIRSNGKLVGAYGVYADITQRKKQEQALADELTRRRLLIDQSLDGIVVLDADARVVEANQRFADMLGYTPEEVRELHTWDWDRNFPPEKILEMGRTVDEKGFHLETKHTRKDGSVIDVDISINGAMFGDQKLIFCVGRDVTARNKMAEALKLSAEEWRRTFDSISDAISIHDRDFRIQQANKAFTEIFQVDLDRIIGKCCYELHKGEKPQLGCPQKQTLATGKPGMAEFYESHLGKYLMESTSPILNEKGEVVGIVHVTRDVTEQKLQRERFMMTDRLASLGELAAGTAHELNNPLTSIIGFSQLLMEKDIPENIREDAKFIYDEAQRAANVTKNLLCFARKHAPVKQLNQINSIIEDVLELRSYEHKINSIDVERHLAPDLPKIMVDYFQMQQVFMNIIINAEYFMTDAHKGGTLTITTKKQNGTVMISIADDGPGISPENRERIFDPFFTTKPAGKGTGLGLSICHGIVIEHGGQIYVKSQLGKGATFVVELPINTRDHIKTVS